jgi:hypothetical protein
VGRQKIPEIPLTPAHIAQFHRDAGAALARRGPGYFAERSWVIAEVMLMAIASLLGLWLWEAPALTMLALLLASAWFGILGEWAKALLLRKAVEREMETTQSDQFVWLVTVTLKMGHKTIKWAESDAPGTLRALLVVDLLCAGMATVMLILMIRDGAHDLGPLLAPGVEVVVPFALTFAFQATGLVWLVSRHRAGHGELAPPRSTAGLRGLLMLPMVAVMFVGSSDGYDLRGALTAFNGVMLLLVAPLMALLLLQARREVSWLRAHLAGTGQTSSDRGPDRAPGDGEAASP